MSAHTNSLARDFLNSSYVSNSKAVSYKFSLLIPNHPSWRRATMQPWGVLGKKLLLGDHVTEKALSKKPDTSPRSMDISPPADLCPPVD